MIFKKFSISLHFYFSTVFLSIFSTFNAMDLNNKPLVTFEKKSKLSNIYKYYGMEVHVPISIIKQPHLLDVEYIRDYLDVALIMRKKYNIPKEVVAKVLIITRIKHQKILTKERFNFVLSHGPEELKSPFTSLKLDGMVSNISNTRREVITSGLPILGSLRSHQVRTYDTISRPFVKHDKLKWIDKHYTY
ncbi:MAG TPA: hypothetical protein VL201_00790 [Patescibacteria group bacterium]|nr:hypothetical protein [Patescibacteria group bacterium]